MAGEAAPADRTVEEGGARICFEEPVAEALDEKILDAQIDGDHIHFAFFDPPSGANGECSGHLTSPGPRISQSSKATAAPV